MKLIFLNPVMVLKIKAHIFLKKESSEGVPL